MQILQGKLIQADVTTPKPNKTTGELKSPYLSLSILSTFSVFGSSRPEVVNVSVPLDKAEYFSKLLNKEIDIRVLFPKPQYNLTYLGE